MSKNEKMSVERLARAIFKAEHPDPTLTDKRVDRVWETSPDVRNLMESRAALILTHLGGDW